MSKPAPESVTQLEFKRRWLMARLDRGRRTLATKESEGLIREIEDLDLAISATPAQDFRDLLIKAHLLETALAPEDGNHTCSLEDVLLAGLLADLERLAVEAST